MWCGCQQFGNGRVMTYIERATMTGKWKCIRGSQMGQKVLLVYLAEWSLQLLDIWASYQVVDNQCDVPMINSSVG